MPAQALVAKKRQEVEGRKLRKERWQLEDGTALELELQARKGGSSYYKGVSVSRGYVQISLAAASAAGVTKRSHKTEVDAAKAIALAKHEQQQQQQQ